MDEAFWLRWKCECANRKILEIRVIETYTICLEKVCGSAEGSDRTPETLATASSSAGVTVARFLACGLWIGPSCRREVEEAVANASTPHGILAM